MSIRYLIVNADDFGRSPGTNRGIIRAHEEGILTSASLMTRYTTAAEAGEYARMHPELSVGLHLDLGEYRYLPEEYDWVMNYRVVHYEDAPAVEAEVGRQLDRFRELTGSDPSHLDSHQHVHRKEPSRQILSAIAERFGIPLRQALGGVHYCGLFHGESYDGLDASDDISVEGLIRILTALGPGVTELACHPGLPDEGKPDGYLPKREQEVRTLCDLRARQALEILGIQLTSFHHVAELAR